jgi:RNA polymerase-binding transcription factor
MKSAELQRFQRILQGLLGEMEQPRQQRDEIAVDNAHDTIDLVQRAAERDMVIRRIESNFSRARAIKLALERVEEGSYGTCLACEEDISPKRLQAVPWAAYCVHCQDAADRARKDRNADHMDAFSTADVA